MSRLIFLIPFLFLHVTAFAEQSEDLNDIIFKIAANSINKNAPIQLDRYTYVQGATYSRYDKIFSKKILVLKSYDEINMLKKQIEIYVNNNLCTTPENIKPLTDGVKFKESFYSKDGKFVFLIVADRLSCAR